MSWQLLPCTEFAGLEDSWRKLHQRCGANQVLDFDFVDAAVRHFAEPDITLAVRGDPDSLIAMAFLVRSGRGRWSSFQPSQAPLGLWLQDSTVPLPELIEELRATLPSGSLALGVQQLDPDFLPRPAETGRIRTMDYIETARITVPGSFDEYWKSRGKNLRKNVRRQSNLLEREGIVPQLRVLDRPEQARSAIEAYGSLESSGWKAAGGTAIHIDNAQGRFYAEIMEHYMSRGEAFIWQFHYDDTLVATDLCLQREGTLIILKTTYDESQSTTSPAHLMRRAAFEQLFDSSTCRTVEFYGPAKEWHRRWSDEIRAMYHVTCYRYAWVPAVAGMLRGLGRSRPPAADGNAPADQLSGSR